MSNSPLTKEEVRAAVQLGLARAMSEAGLTPSGLESKIASLPRIISEPVSKTAGVLDTIGNLASKGLLFSILGGAAIGSYTGSLRNKIERDVEGKDDPEVNKTQRMIDGYNKMTDELRTTTGASK